MITVKITHPNGWEKNGHWAYRHQILKTEEKKGDFKFLINDSTAECDYWIIHESTDHVERAICNPENVLLVPGEDKGTISSYDPDYVGQFGGIITSRDDIFHPSVIRTFYMCPWSVRKTKEQLLNLHPPKTEDFSAVISNNVSTGTHLKRYAFVNRLKGHFKDKLIWFGKGENWIEDKWDGLERFRYSLAIENYSAPFYFTEKIMDCYCASAMPLYWGCTNITDYFPEQSMVKVDLDDFRKSIALIEGAIDEGTFEKNYKYILEAKERVLLKYNFISGISDIIKSRAKNLQVNRRVIRIKPKSYFDSRSRFRSRVVNILMRRRFL
jgi:hypothetical protein